MTLMALAWTLALALTLALTLCAPVVQSAPHASGGCSPGLGCPWQCAISLMSHGIINKTEPDE